MVELFLPRSFISQEITVCAVCSLGLEEGKRTICFCAGRLPAGSCGVSFLRVWGVPFWKFGELSASFSRTGQPGLVKERRGCCLEPHFGKMLGGRESRKTKTIIGAYGCRAASEQSHFGKKKPSEAFERFQNRQEDFP